MFFIPFHKTERYIYPSWNNRNESGTINNFIKNNCFEAEIVLVRALKYVSNVFSKEEDQIISEVDLAITLSDKLIWIYEKDRKNRTGISLLDDYGTVVKRINNGKNTTDESFSLLEEISNELSTRSEIPGPPRRIGLFLDGFFYKRCSNGEIEAGQLDSDFNELYFLLK